jgi:hypothetical protein
METVSDPVRAIFEVLQLERDKQYGEWLQIWNELTQMEEKYDGYDTMIGHTSDLFGTTAAGGTIAKKTLYIPLQFWFCRNAGLALPLIALQLTY